MNDRGRPEKLTDDIKLYITRLQKDRKKKLKAPAVQAEIRNYLEKDIKAQAEDQELKLSCEAIKEAIEERLPGLSSIQKYLSENNDRNKPSELDNPWHMGTLDKYPIPAEALEYIFLIQNDIQKQRESNLVLSGKSSPLPLLTIRQAKWISRLYFVMMNQQNKKLKFSDVALLFSWVVAYAQREMECNLAGIDFDTTTLDEKFRKFDGYPVTEGKTTIVLYHDKSFSIDTLNKELQSNFNEYQRIKDGGK